MALHRYNTILIWGNNTASKVSSIVTRGFADACGAPSKKGVVVGVYDGGKLTAAGCKINQECEGRLQSLLRGDIPVGKAKIFCNLSKEFSAVSVAGLGPEGVGYNEDEVLNECKENIRIATGVGAQALQEMRIGEISVEGVTSAEAAAEGAVLGVWRFQKYKNRHKRAVECEIKLFCDPDEQGFEAGRSMAKAQNIARDFEEAPANKMNPIEFAQKAIRILCPCGVSVEVRDRDWIETKKMTAILGVAKNSCHPPLFLEMTYCGGGEDDKPVTLIGKGLTFDSGSLCLRKAKGMSEYRADLAGGAVCVGVLKAAAALRLPLNIVALVPLCENMPGGNATRPGDVVYGLNHKSIRIHQTDHVGRVLIADALSYASQFKPCLAMSIASLTNGIRRALGGSSTGVFCNSRVVWKELEKAGAETGDRVWRMPLWKYYCKKVTKHKAFDVVNMDQGGRGSPGVAAAFLMQFAPPIDFVHLDITGTGMLAASDSYPYLRKGKMTGRPTRTIIKFFNQMACP